MNSYRFVKFFLWHLNYIFFTSNKYILINKTVFSTEFHDKFLILTIFLLQHIKFLKMCSINVYMRKMSMRALERKSKWLKSTPSFVHHQHHRRQNNVIPSTIALLNRHLLWMLWRKGKKYKVKKDKLHYLAACRDMSRWSLRCI